MRSVLVAALILLGCGDPEGSDTGDGGTGGQATGMGGQSAGTAGTASSGQSGGAQAGSSPGGGDGCAERWSEYEPLGKSARLCDPNAAAPECKFSVVVLDACGCSVPANGSSPDYAPARQRLSKYAEDCDFPEECESCPATLEAGCVTNAAGVSQCEYQ